MVTFSRSYGERVQVRPVTVPSTGDRWYQWMKASSRRSWLGIEPPGRAGARLPDFVGKSMHRLQVSAHGRSGRAVLKRATPDSARSVTGVVARTDYSVVCPSCGGHARMAVRYEHADPTEGVLADSILKFRCVNQMSLTHVTPTSLQLLDVLELLDPPPRR